MRRKLYPGEDRSEEPEEQSAGLRNLADQMADGYAGVRALQASAWEAPADLKWDEAEDNWAIEPTVDADRVAGRLSLRTIATAAGIFLLAALPRLFVIFFVTDPQNPGLGWYGDTFHHWQIAYLSKEIGFSHGFLRLWDFKGLEYFWGLLHPLLLAGLFELTGTADILIPRFLSLVAGSVNVALMYFIARRYFNPRVALAALLFSALNPVGLFSDASGMQEPLGIMLLLGGVLLYPRHAVFAGFMWALAGMVRAEYWLMGAGLLAAVLLMDSKGARRGPLAVGWILPSLVYMKYLLAHTGNPIYPIYWNFLGNAAGAWMENVEPTDVQVVATWAFRGLAILSASGLYLIYRRKPRHYLPLILGLGNILFLSVLLGFSEYVLGFLPRFMVDRIFVLPYMFLGLLLAAVLFEWLPRRGHPRIWIMAGWAMFVGIIGISQLAWKPIWYYYEPGTVVWTREREVASLIALEYEGGVISMMEDRPWLTYFLVQYHGIPAESIDGQMYDPFAYMTGDPFANWEENRGVVLNWLADRNIQLLVFYSGKASYEEMIRREPELFQFERQFAGGEFTVYRVLIGQPGAAARQGFYVAI